MVMDITYFHMLIFMRHKWFFLFLVLGFGWGFLGGGESDFFKRLLEKWFLILSYLNVINMYLALPIPELIFIAEVKLLLPLLPLSTMWNRNSN